VLARNAITELKRKVSKEDLRKALAGFRESQSGPEKSLMFL
jgi:hypothetical protein